MQSSSAVAGSCAESETGKGRGEVSRRQALRSAAAGLVAAACASDWAENWSGARVARAAQGKPNGAGRPNFLFIVADQHRHDWLGCAGQGIPVRTPNLDALAAWGMRLTQAYCASPVCGPSRACLASGREYDACRVLDHKGSYPLDQVTYYRLLRDAGYHVMGCGKFDLHKSTYDWGVDGQHLLKEWGFSAGIDSAGKWDALKQDGAAHPHDPYMAYLQQRGLAEVHERDLHGRGHYQGTDPTPLDEEAYCDNWSGRQAMRLLEEAPAGRPWHLQVNFAGPHEPMDVTAAMHGWYRRPPVSFPLPHAADASTTAEHHQEVRRNYAAMIQNIDRWVGLLIEVLRSRGRGELENTIVVYSSDHGEMLGDHGRWEKHCPYEASVRVPLILAGPQIRPGTSSDALVSLIDVGATLLDYAGVPRAEGMQSLSLRPLLQGLAGSHRTCLRAGLGPWRMARDRRYKLIRGFEPSMAANVIMGNAQPATPLPQAPMLFDLAGDAGEDHDLAGSRPEEVARLGMMLGKA